MRPTSTRLAPSLLALVAACGLHACSAGDAADAGADARDAHAADHAEPDAATDDAVDESVTDDDAVAVDDTTSDLDADDLDATDLDAGDATAPTDAHVTDAARDAGTPDSGDPYVLRREHCDFAAGSHVGTTLGFTSADRSHLPIRNIIVMVQENRSFDHYFGHMGRANVDGVPASYTNRIPGGGTARPSHATTTCIGPDVPHSWAPMHDAWDHGAMDGFYAAATAGGNNGQRALRYYTPSDLPFYDWLYRTYAMSDRFFCSVLGPTWPNRDYLYTATSQGVINTFQATDTARSIFDELGAAGVTYGVYARSHPREDCIGWSDRNTHFHDVATFLAQLHAGTLPRVAFIDGEGAGEEEHPPSDISAAEHWMRTIYEAIVASPLWPHTVFFLTYDESGGFFDHVPPPATCVPDGAANNAAFNRMGPRIPFVAVSPYARPGYVSHSVHQTTSITRFIELVHDLPALTKRDANSDALLDLFDFSHPALLHPPAARAAGASHCP